MDKLKPILAQKFWILSGLCLLIPLTGWWMTTAAMSSEYVAREKAIKDAFNGIPLPGPNKNWTDRVVALNAEEEQKVKQTGEYLWNQQQSLMTWPEVVASGVEKSGFRGEIDAKTRSEYRSAYEQELVDLHKIPKPFDPLTGTGCVEFPIELIPTLSWGRSPIPPSSQQMWDSQEDIWLFRSILQAIAIINEQFGNGPNGNDSIVNSKIKQIQLIELRGGTPGGAAAAAEALAGAMPGEGMMGGPGAMPGGPGSMPGGMNGVIGGASGMGAGEAMQATFDPAEQLGSDDMVAEVPEGGMGEGGMPGGPGGMMPGAGPMGGPGGSGGATVKKRYIEETPRFKTRGFYMELVMDHRVLPEFLAELSDSKWPLRVIRVQSVDLNLDDISTGGALGTAGPGMAGGMGKGPGAMRSAPMRPSSAMRGPGMMGAGGPGAGGGRFPRPNVAARVGGEFGGGGNPESTLDIQSAMSDPYLVNVALSGIITLYLPPEVTPGAQPGTEGAPGTAPVAGDSTAAAIVPEDGTGTNPVPAVEGTPEATAGATTDAAENPTATTEGTPDPAAETPPPSAPSTPDQSATPPAADLKPGTK